MDREHDCLVKLTGNDEDSDGPVDGQDLFRHIDFANIRKVVTEKHEAGPMPGIDRQNRFASRGEVNVAEFLSLPNGMYESGYRIVPDSIDGPGYTETLFLSPILPFGDVFSANSKGFERLAGVIKPAGGYPPSWGPALSRIMSWLGILKAIGG